MRLNKSFCRLVLAVSTSLLLTACGDSAEVKLVKQGELRACPKVTLEQMVNSFLGSPSWESGKSSEGTVFVNVGGDLTVQGEKARAEIQFVVNAADQSFQLNGIRLNGVPQMKLMAAGLLMKMCESAKG